MKHLILLLLVLLQIGGWTAAWAQSSQYIGPGNLALATSSTQERVLQGAEEARWKFGRWRLSPLFSVRNVGYQDNVFGAGEGEEQISDTHASAGFGLDSYLALSRKAYLAAFVAPEYTYWNEVDQLRQFNVNYGAGFFGFFNRLEVGLHVRSTERESPLSSEIEIPVRISEERGVLDLRLQLRASIFLIGSASSTNYRHSRDLDTLVGFDPHELDRDEELFRSGLALRMRNGFELGLGLEDEQVDFRMNPQLRSYSGTNPLLTASMEGRRIQVNATVVRRRLDFPAGSMLDRLEETTGRFRVSADVARDTRLVTYGSRALVFSVVDASGIVLEDRWGVLLGRKLGRRFSAEAFAESGFLDFESPDPALAVREDDVQALGANLGFELSNEITARLSYSELQFSSNIQSADRSVTRIGIALSMQRGLVPW